MNEQQDARHLLDQAEAAAGAGDLASAGELLRGAARIQEEELGPLHPDLANTLNNLAIVSENTGRSGEAETLYRRAAAIAAAALPPDHPMVVASRQNLEDFCRARGLSIEVPAPLITPTRDIEREVKAALPSTGRSSRSVAWVAAGAVVLVAAVLLVLRPWSSRDASVPTRAVAQPAKNNEKSPGVAAPRRDSRTPATDKPGFITVTTAQVCRTFSASGSNWRCDPVGRSAAPGPMVLYTRVRAERDTAVWHRWYQGDTLRQSVMLRVEANATEGYRTYSRLTVDEGDWRLEVRNVDGQLLHEQRFTVR
jgi:LPXTG-motif cell wall-anchored protein